MKKLRYCEPFKGESYHDWKKRNLREWYRRLSFKDRKLINEALVRWKLFSLDNKEVDGES